MSLQRSFEGLNGITFPDASGQCIPERWSNIPEGSLTVLVYRFVLESLGLGTSRRDLEGRSERARGGVEMTELREVEKSVSMN